MSVLDVQGLDAVYGSLQALWDVSITVEPGQVVVIAGPNGAGKSTFMGAAAGVVKSPAGRVHVADTDVTNRGYSARMRAGMAWVPEGRNTFAHLSVRDNLGLSAWLAGTRKRLSTIEKSIFELFPIVKERYDQKAGELSGGQQQIVALARALVREPKVALLDEPTIGLAPSIVARLGDAIKATSEQGIAWIVAEQNLAWLESLADSVYTMRGGRLTLSGGPEVLSSRDVVRSAFFEA